MSVDAEAGAGIGQIVKERDLYLRLLELNTHEDLQPFLEEALALIVETSGAERGYLELYDPSDRSELPRWWIRQGIGEEELDNVRKQLSSRIIARALATGELVETASAVLDSRFSDSESVRRNQIRAVLCAPIGVSPPVGVLYLQGRIGGSFFSPEDRRRAQAFARHLGPLAGRVVARHSARVNSDPTVPYREKFELTPLIGRSSPLSRVLAGICVAAPLGVTVLLSGATGSGKSLAARVIHDNGPRAHAPFVPFSCAHDGAETLLFGALGAPGRVVDADGGTLYLDEIGELSAGAQAKLLQLLDTRRFVPIGASAPITADVRLIASTTTPLTELVASGRFREDLLYRIQVLTIPVPSLAERREDIGLLAQHFCAQACARHSLARLRLSLGALETLEVQEWPGNIRELANVVEHAVLWATGHGALMIERAHLFPELAVEPAEENLSWQESTRRFQKRLLERALVESEWSISKAARRLDLARSHIYNLIATFGIQRESRT
ncbi:MAG: sigma 54-interacting transcriptional regulator [Nannocystaceae bacterium]